MNTRTKPASKTGNENTAETRRQQIDRVGELLAELLENPMTPVAIFNDIADTITELTLESQKTAAADTRKDWPQIAEFLLSTKGRLMGE